MTRRPLIVGTFLLAYLLSYFYRSTNAVLADDLTRDAGLSPEQLGAMTSLFFAAFAAAQLPLGAALDRWGPRVVTPVLMLAAVAGALATAAAEGFAGLVVGRALIGFGMAGVLMGALKAFAAWFPPERFATVSAVFVGLGSIGALGATTPLVALTGALGWRGVFVVAAAATLVAAAAIVAVVRAAPPSVPADGRTPPDASATEGPARPTVGFAQIFADAAFWRLALLVLALVGGLSAFQGLWGGPFMVRGLGLAPTTSATLLLVLGTAATAGFLVAGPLAGRWGLERTMAIGAALAIAALVGLAALPVGTPPALLAPLWAAYGAGAGAGVLGYAAARARFPGAAGRAVTAINVFGIGGSALLQAGLGPVIAAVGAAAGSPSEPPLIAYRAALLAAAMLLAAALVGFTAPARPRRRASTAAPG